MEYAGEAVRNLTMEQRMTLCNMVLSRWRGGMVCAGRITFAYLKGRVRTQGSAGGGIGLLEDPQERRWRTVRQRDYLQRGRNPTDDHLRVTPVWRYQSMVRFPTLDDIEEAGRGSFQAVAPLHELCPGEKLVENPSTTFSGQLHQRPDRGLSGLC